MQCAPPSILTWRPSATELPPLDSEQRLSAEAAPAVLCTHSKTERQQQNNETICFYSLLRPNAATVFIISVATINNGVLSVGLFSWLQSHLVSDSVFLIVIVRLFISCFFLFM